MKKFLLCSVLCNAAFAEDKREVVRGPYINLSRPPEDQSGECFGSDFTRFIEQSHSTGSRFTHLSVNQWSSVRTSLVKDKKLPANTLVMELSNGTRASIEASGRISLQGRSSNEAARYSLLETALNASGSAASKTRLPDIFETLNSPKRWNTSEAANWEKLFSEFRKESKGLIDFSSKPLKSISHVIGRLEGIERSLLKLSPSAFLYVRASARLTLSTLKSLVAIGTELADTSLWKTLKWDAITRIT